MLSLNNTICAVLPSSPIGNGIYVLGFVKVNVTPDETEYISGVVFIVAPLTEFIVPTSKPEESWITIPELKPEGAVLRTIWVAKALYTPAETAVIGDVDICKG